MINALRKVVGIKPRSYTLSVPRIEENEGLLLLGDPGTGKSQVIHANRRRRSFAMTRLASSSRSISILTPTSF
jgi:MoxR-like ATPase